ncbi:MAG: glycosyltransferase [Elusimicrobiales bacterium]
MKKPDKNILIFVNAFWIFGEGMSGGDQMLVQIFKRIRSSFRKVYCCTNDSGREAVSKEIPGIEFLVSPRFYDLLGIYGAYLFRTIHAAVICFKPGVDVLYSSSDFFPDVVPACLYRITHPRVKWVQCVFHIYPDWRTRPGSRVRSFIGQSMQKMSLWFIRRADLIVNINSLVRDELISRGFDAEKIVINTPGIDLASHQAETASEPGYDGLFLARMSPTKGIRELVEIWKNVINKAPGAKLGIVGWGDAGTIGLLRREISENGLEDNIIILGYVPDQRARALMRGAKVFLFPSHEEGFGIAVADALACGLRVVAWDLPVYNEVFGGHITAVKRYDLKQFASAIVEILEERGSARSLKNISDGKQFVGRYSWEMIAEKHRKMLCAN